MGRYRDGKHDSLRFTIAKKGRLLKGFTTQVTATCIDINGQASFASRLLTLPRVKIAPDGAFVARLNRAGQRGWLQGTVATRKVTGYASYQGGSCSGT